MLSDWIGSTIFSSFIPATLVQVSAKNSRSPAEREVHKVLVPSAQLPQIAGDGRVLCLPTINAGGRTMVETKNNNRHPKPQVS
jgi:hypothetical protein